MRYVIVNADDLGLSPGVNRGIIEAHWDGLVTSASLLVDRPASVAATGLLAGAPGLSLGVHVDLSDLDGRPLVDLGDPGACEREVARQVDRFTRLLGHGPSHLDSHRNVHRQPAPRRAFEAVAAAANLRLREHSEVTYVPHFYGQWGGRSHPEQISPDGLIRLLSALPPGWSELGCHPGYVDDQLCSSYRRERELELAALVDPRVRAAARGLEITFVSSADRPATPAASRGGCP